MLSEKSLLQAQGLVKRYGALTVLDQVSVTLCAGESMAIVGASGSGKTTLLSLLAGLEKPDQGSIRFEEQELTGYDEEGLSRWRAKSVGIVFQDYHLIPSLTALENVGLPLEIQGRPAKEQAEALLERVGLKERRQHYPHQLSGGEQQRVALARALSAQPQILFADEPTGNLDERTAGAIEDLIFELIRDRGLTALVVTHNQSLAKRCTRSLNLHLGRFEA